MTHVVLESCIRCKYTDCVDVCPVDCFREGPNFLTIDPDECIDCAVCIPECPVNAIVPEEDVPGDQQHMIKLNADLAKKWPSITKRKARAARRRRVERPHRQARRADQALTAADAPRTMEPNFNDEVARHRRRARRPDRDRCRDRRRRPGRPVPGLRARPARDQGPHHRLARLPRRPVHRALPRQADLRHPGRAGVHRQGAHRQPAQADRALRRDLPPRPGSDRRAASRTTAASTSRPPRARAS